MRIGSLGSFNGGFQKSLNRPLHVAHLFQELELPSLVTSPSSRQGEQTNELFDAGSHETGDPENLDSHHYCT
jgi:hypothetical protein